MLCWLVVLICIHCGISETTLIKQKVFAEYFVKQVGFGMKDSIYLLVNCWERCWGSQYTKKLQVEQ